MKTLSHYTRENLAFAVLFALVFAVTFVALSVDADSVVYNQPPSCTISLRDVPTGYPQVGPVGTGYPMLLSWGSSNATSASISPSMGSVPPVGSRVVYVRGEKFSMAVYGPRGNATCQTTDYLLPTLYLPGSIAAGPIFGSSMFQPTYSTFTNYPTGQYAAQPVYTGVPVAQAPRHVSLTQIPYTGAGDAAMAMLAWLSIIMLAFFGAVMIAQRGQFVEKVAARLRG